MEKTATVSPADPRPLGLTSFLWHDGNRSHPGAYGDFVITVGIDLSANPKKTGVAVIDWGESSAVLREVRLGANDADLLALIASADKAGIDCPFGWPDLFVSMVADHQAGKPVTISVTREEMRLRQTDIWARRVIQGLVPLSVSTDKLGIAAMRCATLLGALEKSGVAVDRTGAGPVCEVYPGAALAAWGIARQGYKGAKTAHVERRHEMLPVLVDQMPWLDLAGFEEVLVATDDALDALLCAVIARWQIAGWCWPVPRSPEEGAEAAAREGWMSIPRSDIGLRDYPALGERHVEGPHG